MCILTRSCPWRRRRRAGRRGGKAPRRAAAGSASGTLASPAARSGHRGVLAELFSLVIVFHKRSNCLGLIAQHDPDNFTLIGPFQTRLHGHLVNLVTVTTKGSLGRLVWHSFQF